MTVMFNKDNFYKNTFGTWSRVSFPRRAPDHVSESGSRYWYEKGGVVRVSNHWGAGISGSHWRLRGDPWRSCSYERGTWRAGFIRYRSLRPCLDANREQQPWVKRMWALISRRRRPYRYVRDGIVYGEGNRPLSKREIAAEERRDKLDEERWYRMVRVRKSHNRRMQCFIRLWARA